MIGFNIPTNVVDKKTPQVETDAFRELVNKEVPSVQKQQDPIVDIYKMAETNPVGASQAYGFYLQAQNLPDSGFYRPYVNSTNSAIQTLTDMGYDLSGGVDGFLEQNTWMKNLYRYGNTNTPLAPTKTSTPEETAAYYYYQLDKAQNDTVNARNEWAALQQELGYWANRKDRNMTDDEIVAKINWKNYPTLAKMDELQSEGRFLELNDAIGYDRSYLPGVIWASRNEGYADTAEVNYVRSLLGEGNVWQEDPDIRAKLDPTNREQYNPYAVGMTEPLDKAALYFGANSFDAEWLENNRQYINDPNAGEYYQQVRKAEQNTQKAEAELEDLRGYIQRQLDRGETNADRILNGLWDEYPTLRKMDDTISGGEIMATTRAIDYRHSDIENWVKRECDRISKLKPAQEFFNNITNNAVNEEDAAKAKTESDNVSRASGVIDSKGTPNERGAVKQHVTNFNNLLTETTEQIVKNTISMPFYNLVKESNTDVANKYFQAQNYLLQSQKKVAEYEETVKKNEEYLLYAQKNLNNILTDSYKWIQGNLNGQQRTITVKDANGNDRDVTFTVAYHPVDFSHGDYVMQSLDGNVDRNDPEVIEAINDYLKSEEFLKDDQGFAPATEKAMRDIAEAQENLDDSKRRQADAQAQYEQDQLDVFKDVDEANARLHEVAQFTGADESTIDMFRDAVGYAYYVGSVYKPTEWQSQDIYTRLIDAGYDMDTTSAYAEMTWVQAQEELQQLNLALEFITQYNTAGEFNTDVYNNCIREKNRLEREIKAADYFLYQNESDFKKTVSQAKQDISAKINNGEIPKGGDKKEFYAVMPELDGLENTELKATTYMHALSENERDTYLYLYATQGKEKADEYYDFLTDSEYGVIPTRVREKETEAIQGLAEQYPISMTVASHLINVTKPVGLMYSAWQSATGHEINPNSPFFTSSVFVGTTRQTAKEQITKNVGGGFIGRVAEIGYDVVTSAIDSWINAQMMGGVSFGSEQAIGALKQFGLKATESFVSAAPLGLGAATDAIMDAKYSGVSNEQAWLMAGATFISETGTEAISYGNIHDAFGKAAAGDIKGFIGYMKTVVGDMFEEGLGESVNEMFSQWSEEKIMGTLSHKAELINQYRAENPDLLYPEAEEMAEKELWKEVLYAGLTGALSGGLSTSVSIGYGAVTDAYGKHLVRKVYDDAFTLANNTGNTNLIKDVAAETLAAEMGDSASITAARYMIGNLSADAIKSRLDSQWARIEAETKNGAKQKEAELIVRQQIVAEIVQDAVQNEAQNVIRQLPVDEETGKPQRPVLEADARVTNEQAEAAGVNVRGFLANVTSGLTKAQAAQNIVTQFVSQQMAAIVDAAHNAQSFEQTMDDLRGKITKVLSEAQSAEQVNEGLEAEGLEAVSEEQMPAYLFVAQQLQEEVAPNEDLGVAAQQAAGQNMTRPKGGEQYHPGEEINPEDRAEEVAALKNGKAVSAVEALESSTGGTPGTQRLAIASVFASGGVSQALASTGAYVLQNAYDNANQKISDITMLATKMGIPFDDLMNTLSVAAVPHDGESNNLLDWIMSGNLTEETVSELMEAAQNEANDPAALSQIQSQIHDTRVADAVASKIAEGALNVASLEQQLKAARAKRNAAAKRLETAHKKIVNLQNKLNQAIGNYLDNTSNQNAMGMATRTARLLETLKEVTVPQYEQELENAENSVSAAEEAYNQASDEQMANIRMEAEAEAEVAEQEALEIANVIQNAENIAQEVVSQMRTAPETGANEATNPEQMAGTDTVVQNALEEVVQNAPESVVQNAPTEVVQNAPVSAEQTTEQTTETTEETAEPSEFTAEEEQIIQEAVDKLVEEKPTPNTDTLDERARQRYQALTNGTVDTSQSINSADAALLIGRLSKRLNVPIEVGELPAGRRARYSNGTITLSNKLTVGQAMVEASLHEITHALEGTEAYNTYANFVASTLYPNESGLNAAIAKKIADYGKSGVKLDRAGALQEIVADFARTHLNQPAVVERLCDNGLGHTIRNALHNINQFLKNLRLTGQARVDAENLRKAENLFNKAINARVKNAPHPQAEQFSIPQMASAMGLYFDENTKLMYTKPGGERITNVTPDMFAKTPLGMLLDVAVNGGTIGKKKNRTEAGKTITPEQGQQIQGMFADLMSLCATYGESDSSNIIWEVASSTLESTFSALKGNSDKQYGSTIDFGTVCAKTQAIVDVLSQIMIRMAQRGENGGLTRTEVMKVYNAVFNANLSVPCPVCYVFSRWMGVPSLLGSIDKYQHDYVKTKVENGETVIDPKATQAVVDEYVGKALEKYGSANNINSAKSSIYNKQQALENKRIKVNTQLAEELKGQKREAVLKQYQNEIEEIDAKLSDLDAKYNAVDAYNWITQALCYKNENGEYKVDPKFKLTPPEVLYNLANTGEFAANYAKNWAYRNTRGAGMGKAILPYSGIILGDIINGMKNTRTVNNPFYGKSRTKALQALNNAVQRQKAQNLIGGQRLQSTSDFRPEWGLDYLMAFLELQAMHSNAQMYTKVAEAVDFLATTGADVNLSIMGLGNGFHEVPAGTKDSIELNGKHYVMDFSSTTGMDYETAKGLKDKYDNVQMILVGMNDTHCLLAMKNGDIDFIIPWHSSGNKKTVLQGLVSSVNESLNESSDYTKVQSDKRVKEPTAAQEAAYNARINLLTGADLSEGDLAAIFDNPYLLDLYKRFKGKDQYGNDVEHDPDCYGVTLAKSQAEQIFPYEYWDTTSTKATADINGTRFIEYCESLGIIPRFSGIQTKNGEVGNFTGRTVNEDGTVTYNPVEGYWKVLIDRPMYANDGSYRPQQAIDITDIKVGALDGNGNLQNSTLPLEAKNAKYGDQEKYDQAIMNFESRKDEQPNLAVEETDEETDEEDEQESIGGEITDADIDQMLADMGLITQDKYSAPLEGQNPSLRTGPGQRQFGAGMLQRSDEISEAAKQYVLANNAYTPDTNAAQLDRAMDWIRSNKRSEMSDGFAESLELVSSNTFDYRSADGQARIVALMGMAAAKNDIMAQVALADAFNREGTDLGRALQARRLFKLMTPEGRIAALDKMKDNVKNEFLREGKDLDVTFSEWIYRAAAAATEEGDFERVYKAAAQELADQIPANWRDRLRSWRMLSMLFNPRTHVRNIVGNALFIPAVELKNRMGALGEILTKQENRTKSFNPFLSKDIRDFATQDAIAIKDRLTGEAKYSEGNAVQRAQNPLPGVLRVLSDFNTNALEGEDWFFLKGHYRRALGGWMKANGYTVEQLQNNPELLEKGREYAINEAQKATYRDFNGLAQKLSQFSRNTQTTGQKVGGFLVDAVLPFKKTPANILKRGLEYSPIGLARSLTTDIKHLKDYINYQNGKLAALPEKALSPTQFIDRLCSGLTGTGILMMGAFLSSMGVVSCGLDDDDDAFEKAKGNQEYSIKFKLLGEDVTFTMDWAAPMSLPFFVGAALYEMSQDEYGLNTEDLVNAIGGIAEPMMNLSMLDSVDSILKVSQSEDSSLMQILAKVGTNYVSSYIPSVLGATARTIDDTRRKSFVESGKGGGIMGTMRYSVEQTENKIPGLSQSNIPVRDVWGNAQKSGLAERILENFVLPGYVERYKEDPVTNELAALYEETGSTVAIPKEPNKTFSADGKKYTLTAEQWDAYKEARGQAAYNKLDELFKTDAYQNASAADRVSYVDAVWDYANSVGKHAVDDSIEIEDGDIEHIVRDIDKKKESKRIDNMYSEAYKALDDGDFDAFYTMQQALYDSGADDSAIKTRIGNRYRDKWKEAYRAGDTTRQYEIEDILFNTGYKFNIKDWQAAVDKEK